MASSHAEEVAEQVRGRDLDPPAKGRGKKDKSRDPLTSLDSRVTRLEIAMADTKSRASQSIVKSHSSIKSFLPFKCSLKFSSLPSRG